MRDFAPMVTAIIPTYRRPQMLRRAIRSALAQTYPNLIVAVYDNASGDETAAVVAEFAAQDSRVRYHCHPENIGANANFVYAMQHVETPYFSLLSDDDALLPDFYARAVSDLTRFEDALLFAGTTVLVSPVGKVIGAPLTSWPRDGYYPAPDGFYAMMEYAHVMILGVLFRREIIDQVGTLDVSIAPSDSDLLLRAAARFPLVVSREPCAVFLVHPNSASALTTLQFMGNDWPKIMANIQADERIPAEVRARGIELLLPGLVDRTYRTGVKSVVAGNFSEGRDAATYLREFYDSPAQARRLDRMNAISRWIPPVHWGLALAYQAQRLRHQRSDKRLQKQFSALTKYLEIQ
jgi:glycosyltransferase involved in cell wall biosynthesis